MKWQEFLDTAARLAQGPTEGDWRSAISRSYYAVFHYFRGMLLANGLDVGKGGEAHFNLYAGLLNCGFNPVSAIGSRIDSLRGLRTRADYDLNRQINQRLALNAVQEGKTVVVDFQAVMGQISAAHITAGAKSYLQAIGRLGKTP